MAENSILIQVELTSSKNEKTFKNIEKQAENSGLKAGDKFGKNFSSKINTNLKSIGKQALLLAGSLAVVQKTFSAIGNSFDDLRVFSRSLGEVNSILPRTQKLTEQTTQAFIELSASFGTSQARQAKAFYNIVSAGVKGTAKQLDTLKVSNEAAVAGLVDIDQAAKAIVSSVNAYAKSGLTAKQASDALFVAVREGQTTFGELSDFLGNATSVAANAGVEFTELAGAVAFVTKSGIDTATATTGLRQVIASIIKPTKEATDEAKRLGLEFNTTALRSKNLAGFLADVQQKTGGNELSLSKLFGNIRALAPILSILNGNFDEFRRILDETRNSTGATSEAANNLKSTLDFKVTQLNSELQSLGLNLIRFVEPAIKTTAESFRTFVNLINRGFKKESTDEVSRLRKELNELGKEYNFLADEIAIKEKFDFFPDTDKEIKQWKARQQEILDIRSSLKQKIQSLNNEELQQIRQKNQEELNLKQQQLINEISSNEIFKQLQSITTDFIRSETLKRLEIAQQALQNGLISQTAFNEIELQLKQNQVEKINELERLKAETAINTNNSIAKATSLAFKNIKSDTVGLGKSLANLAVNGFGRSFQAIGAALANGTSASQAFVQSAKSLISEVASAFGDYYIKLGIATLASPNPAGGTAMIAGGAALKVLAGALGASAGGTATTSGSFAGGGFGENQNIADAGINDLQQVEERKPETNVNIVVEGSLVRQEELGDFITNTLNESFGKQGVTLTNARIA